MKFDLETIDWTAIGVIISFIMIIVTFVVLHRQINQNHQENQENRLTQIKTTQHQVEMQHLNRFRDVANECVHLFSLNKYIQAAKLLQTDVDAARQIIDNAYAESLLTISHYNLASKNNNEKMDNSLNIGISEIGILLDDLQLICVARSVEACKDFSLFKEFVINDKEASDILVAIVKEYRPQSTYANDVSMIAYKRVIAMRNSKTAENTVNAIIDYINSEQARIDKILLEH